MILTGNAAVDQGAHYRNSTDFTNVNFSFIVFIVLRRLEPFGTKSLDVRNTFFRHYLVNT